ncbi:MAG: branched chain amino acid ABC transporter substrate-binding protein [Deltaproteobacteria bacterium]|nr:MAG: branched chain amino acid ABC transporter substrate-binding protein [Deltaproteobacteria bacterium]
MFAVSMVTAASAAETFKIGVAGAHSGDLASYGLPTVKATQVVVEDINAQGGINGAKVEILVEDDVCKPEVATNTATKLVSEKVNAVIGHICSGATKAALPIYRDADILVISPSATNPELTQSGDYPNFYRTIASDDAQARLEVDFATDVLKLKKIAVIHDKGDYGKGLAEYAKKFIEEGGKAEVVLYEGVTPGAVDYSAVVQKIKRSGAEAVIFGGYHPEASKIVGQMRKKRMKTIFISDDGVKDDTFIKVAGKDAEGVYATGPADVSANPLTKKYRDLFMAKEGAEPGAFFDNAVAAALALTNAFAQAGSADSKAMAEVLHTQTADTPFGAIKFDKQGEPIGIGFVMYQVKDGTYVQVQ